MKRILFSFFLLASFIPVRGQSPAVAEVKAVIDRFFEGIYQGDSSMIRTTLAPSVRLLGVSKSGDLIVDSVGEFLEAIAGSKGPGVLQEKLWNYDIRVDEPIASAVTDYTFFVEGRVTHCGTNAFQLAKLDGGWKIVQIIDTRRKEGCRDGDYNLTDTLHAFLDAWHHAAAVADETVFFGSMAPGGIYLGTDATERWDRDQMAFWAKPYFNRESAWAFTAHDRQIYLNEAQTLAWFEEQLDTWMGECRGSGVLRHYPEGWKIEHYNLAVTVPNDKLDKFLKKIRGKKKG